MLYSELLPSPYIWSVDVCEMDRNENGGAVSYFHFSLALSLTSVSFASLTLSPEINDKMSSIWNDAFPLTVQDSVNNSHWNG